MKSGIRAIDIMNHNVVTCTPDMTVSEIAKLMNKHRIGGLPVCSESNLSGLITERDIMMKVIAKGLNPKEIKVKQVMNAPLKATADKFSDIVELARLMNDYDVSRVPILDSGKLVGIVTNKDVLVNAPELLDVFVERANINKKGKPNHPEAFGVCEACSEKGHLHFSQHGFRCNDCHTH